MSKYEKADSLEPRFEDDGDILFAALKSNRAKKERRRRCSLICLSTVSLVFAATLLVLCYVLLREGQVAEDDQSAQPRFSPDCALPSDPGQCMAAAPRWFYDTAKGQCAQFTWGGCGGNGNNFVTLKECQDSCEVGGREVVDDLEEEDPCEVEPSSGPCEAVVARFYYDKSDGECKSFSYGGCAGNSNNFISKTACQERCAVSGSNPTDDDLKPELCLLDSDTGRCRALVERWFHNRETNQCQLFNWGGCGGNDNNFSSKEKCESYCKVAKQEEKQVKIADEDADVCGLEAAEGPCRGFFQRFFFNTTSGQCDQFIYGGCDGNANNFDNRESCEAECAGHIVSQKNEDLNKSRQNADVCSQPKEVGMCRAAMPRWYFNKALGVCQEFIFGGCGGNDNNFSDEEGCRRACLLSP